MENQDEGLELLDETEAGVLPEPLPTPIVPPIASPASGLYQWSAPAKAAKAPPIGHVPVGIRPIRREELRLDVDGRYPQLTASGTIGGILVAKVHWIARLKAAGADRWIGSIWYKDGAATSFPYTKVDITAIRSPFPGARAARVTFSGGGATKRTVVYKFASSAFRTVNFEFDWAEGKAATTVYDTGSHPNRPASLPVENLTIGNVYRRAGCQVTTSPGGAIPLGKAGADAVWSDLEMHDAMQVYWSRFANKAQWAMWIFFAALHESGTGLGGIMFDDIGPNHRQGTALFVDSFIATPPAGDPAPAAWVERMRFWTACHEMGHAFNLAHSWQKSLGTAWVPLADEPEARSFMNYPYRVSGGQNAFFANFEFRFSDPELLFIRHAPERFVEMGNAAWFDHHAFEEAETEAEPTLALELRVNRERASYEFMEPVWVELKLTNIGDQPRLVDGDVLEAESLTVILKRDGKPARQLVPFREKCRQTATIALMPGESIYGTVLASVGLNGWDVAEPGTHWIQAAAHVGEGDVVSAPLAIRIAPPTSREEEYLAGDLFTQEPARLLVLGGSRVLDRGNAVLQEIVERLPDRRIAIHARVALGNPLTLEYKELIAKDDGLAVKVKAAKPDEATSIVAPALVERAQEAADSFGHIRYRGVVERIATRLAAAGATDEAVGALDLLADTLATREVHGRRVKPEVIEAVKEKRDELRAGAAAPA
ncbi:MAG: hypothetical protein ACM33B_10270 [Pseudomonadota bacterium]